MTTFPKNISPPADYSSWTERNNYYLQEQRKREHEEFLDKQKPKPEPKPENYCFYCFTKIEIKPNVNSYICEGCKTEYYIDNGIVNITQLKTEEGVRSFHCEFTQLRQFEFEREIRRKRGDEF